MQRRNVARKTATKMENPRITIDTSHSTQETGNSTSTTAKIDLKEVATGEEENSTTID